LHWTSGNGGTFAGALLVSGPNGDPFKRPIAKSARARISAVQNFSRRLSRQAAAHFDVSFCRNIWDTLRRFAGQAGLFPVPPAKAGPSMDSMPGLHATAQPAMPVGCDKKTEKT
jgi:hypothetical protein